MIDKEIFIADRDLAKRRLPEETRWDSYGYYIDSVNSWENIKSPIALSEHYGIHKTHTYRFSEICLDLQFEESFTQKELKFCKDYVNLIENSIKHLYTSRYIPELKYDLIELIADWRLITAIPNFYPKSSLDFGAGCGRQGFALKYFFPGVKKYHAVDATYAAYTCQENLFATLSQLNSKVGFVDLFHSLYHRPICTEIEKVTNSEYLGTYLTEHLDESKEYQIIHVPAWFNYSSLIADKSVDLILACHVHNELSRSDFLRLIDIVCTKLSENGYFYVRSELLAWHTEGYDGGVNLHGLDIVSILRGKGIQLCYTSYLYGFQTSVFSRSGKDLTTTINNKLFSVNKNLPRTAYKSTHSKLIHKVFSRFVGLIRYPRREDIRNIITSEAAAYFAAESMLDKWVHRLKPNKSDTLLICHSEGSRAFGEWQQPLAAVFRNVLDLGSRSTSAISAEEKLLLQSASNYRNIVICSQDFAAIESILALKDYTRIQYTYPIIILSKRNNDLKEFFWA